MTKKWPYLVLVLMIVGAIFGWQITRSYLSRKSEISFNGQADQIRDSIQRRINSYTESLYGAKGLFLASKSVERDEWKAYVSAIETQNRLVGEHRLYFAERVSRDEMDAFIHSVRSDTSIRAEGYPSFYIFPVVEASEYFAIKYIEPYIEEGTMMGYNLASTEDGKKQLLKACDLGETTAYVSNDWTGNLSKKAHIINLPVYTKKVRLVTVDDRREHLEGFVGVVFSEDDLLSDVERRNSATGIKFKILPHPPSQIRIKDMPNIKPRFHTQLLLLVADRELSVDIMATHEYEIGKYFSYFPAFVLIMGIICSFLVFSLFMTQIRSVRQARLDVKGVTEELSEKEFFLQQMIKNAPDAIVTMNLLGFLKDMNPAAEQIVGYSASELLERHFSQVGLLTDMSLTKAVQEFALVVSGQTRPPFELELTRKDGRRVWVEAHASRLDVEKQIPQVQVIFRDLTLRKSAEEKLVQVKERLDLALRSAQMGIWGWNATDNVFTWDEFMSGLLNKPAGQLQGKQDAFFASIHPEDRVRIDQEIQSSLVRGSEFNLEFRVLVPEKKLERTLISRGQVYLNEKGRPQQMVGVCWDATDRKKFQAQLVQSQKMETIGVFSGGIAHDLNNQLTPVLGYLNIIARDLGEQHPLYPFLMEANQSARQCTEIIQRLMNFSRSSVQKKERVSIKVLTDDFKKIVTKFLPATIKFSVKLDEPLPLIMGNENEIETVLMNLCANARDAMPDGGQLTLHAKFIDHLKRDTDGHSAGEGSYVCLILSDTGTGMSPEIAQKIFEPFFTTKEKGKGTGLGLAMVFNIIKDHGGWIEVLSEVGKGTSFLIYLPALANEKDDGVSRKPVVPKATDRKWSGTALFVDDEAYMRKLGKTYLERLGFNVLLAVDGVEAVEVYKAHQNIISLVVMDMTMPNQTGRATLHKILTINPKAIIIVASGFSEEGTPEELIAVGAKDYLQKPYTLSVLEDSISKNLV